MYNNFENKNVCDPNHNGINANVKTHGGPVNY